MGLAATCDAPGCGRELDTDRGADAYRLELSSTKLAPADGVRYDIYVADPLSGPKHFCGMQCLAAWVAAGER